MAEPLIKTHSISRTEYERMVEAGVFHPMARLELLDGKIVEMPPQGSSHAAAVDLVEAALRAAFTSDYYVRGQKPLAIDDVSEPEPDVVVVKGAIRDFVGHHPRTAVLVVEVSETTLRYDKERRGAAYARNAIPEYWVLNLKDRVLEVYREPDYDLYADRKVLTANDFISPLSAPESRIVVAELLP